MPAVNIAFSETEYKKLQDEYEKMLSGWAQQGRLSAPPSFEHWVGERLMAATPVLPEEISHMRVFAAVEQLLTSLYVHDFRLAHLGDKAKPAEKSAQGLAQAMAEHFELPASYIKRLQDIITYYQKNIASLLDGEAGSNVPHSAGAVEQAYEDLLDRTTKALNHLDSERAIGRIEGAIALLVSLGIMTRDTAKEKTQTFKSLARNKKKNSAS